MTSDLHDNHGNNHNSELYFGVPRIISIKKQIGKHTEPSPLIRVVILAKRACVQKIGNV